MSGSGTCTGLTYPLGPGWPQVPRGCGLHANLCAVSAADLARAWEQAWSARDADALVALVHDDLEIVTLHRGTLHGPDALRAWVARQTFGVAMHVAMVRIVARDDVAVAETRTEWRYVDGGELAETSSGALAFAVRDGRIARVTVHPDLATALAATGLAEDGARDL